MNIPEKKAKVQLTFNENDECIAVIDSEVDNSYPIDLNSIEKMSYDGEYITFHLNEDIELPDYNYSMEQEDAEELIYKFENWKANGTPKVETRQLDVQCPNDDDNRIRIAERMKELNKNNYHHEMEIKDLNSHASSHREGIKQNNELLKKLCDEYEAEFVNRTKACIVVRDYENSEIRYLDPDTGEVVESAAMTASDKQTSLDDILPEKEISDVAEDSTIDDNRSLFKLKETWWDFATNYENADGTNFNKPGMTEKRYEKIKTVMFDSPKYIHLVQKFDIAEPNEIETLLKEFVEIAYGLMIDNGLIK